VELYSAYHLEDL